MESCVFVNEEFPAEIQKLAKKQQIFSLAKYSNFLYTWLQVVVFFIIHVFIFSTFSHNF